MKPAKGGDGKRSVPLPPPRWAEHLLRLLTPARYRDEILGDLREGFGVRRETDGRGNAVRWYLLQILMSLGPCLAFRIRAPRSSRRDLTQTGNTMIGIFGQDFRYAAKSFGRRRTFLGLAASTLGLGIGLSTAMYSVVHAVLGTAPDYQDPERVVSIWQRVEGRAGQTRTGETRLQFPQYVALRDNCPAFSGVALYAADWGESALAGPDGPVPVRVGAATASLLPTLGISPPLGRWFLPEEEGDRAGPLSQVVVLSHSTWAVRFGGDPELLGRPVVLNGISYTVVGVLPPGFRMQWLSNSVNRAADPGPRDFWVPIGAPGWNERPGSTMWEAVARLAEGVTIEQARVEAGPILAAVWDRPAEAVVIPRTTDEARGIRSPILLLFGASGILLLIACGNVALLSFAETANRGEELGIKTAIGAGPGRILRQALAESLILGACGSAIGALVAMWATPVLVSMAPAIPRLDDVGIDGWVLGFATGLGVLTGLVSGVGPALLHSRDSASPLFLARGWKTPSPSQKIGKAVLSAEVALTFILLVGSGLFVESVRRVGEVSPGFDAEDLVGLKVVLPRGQYPYKDQAATVFMERVLSEIRAAPGVGSASAVNELPFPGRVSRWAGRSDPNDSSSLMPKVYHVAPGYFDLMGIPMVEGRDFSSDDNLDSPPVAVVGESLARALWGNASPIGRLLYYPIEAVRVVGVVRDVRQVVLGEAPPLTFYVPHAQHNRPELTFVARTHVEASGILPALRSAVWAVDGGIVVSEGGSLEDAVARSTAGLQFRTVLMVIFAALAALLASVGITGLTARSVGMRSRELAIRQALGAEDRPLVAGMVGEILLIAGIGIGLGVPGALIFGSAMASLLVGVDTFDLTVMGIVVSLTFFGCALASFIPARRIVRLDTMSVLKRE